MCIRFTRKDMKISLKSEIISIYLKIRELWLLRNFGKEKNVVFAIISEMKSQVDISQVIKARAKVTLILNICGFLTESL